MLTKSQRRKKKSLLTHEGFRGKAPSWASEGPWERERNWAGEKGI